MPSLDLFRGVVRMYDDDRDDDPVIYRFADGPSWPSELGPEPEWFAEAAAELHEDHEAATEFDAACRWTAETSYLSAKGR